MSRLKNMTGNELRNEILLGEEYQRLKMDEADRYERLAEAHSRHASECRRKYHNVGQKITWARVYLARKETGQDAG